MKFTRLLIVVAAVAFSNVAGTRAGELKIEACICAVGNA